MAFGSASAMIKYSTAVMSDSDVANRIIGSPSISSEGLAL